MKPHSCLLFVLLIFTINSFSQTEKNTNSLLPFAKPEFAGFSSERLGRIDETINGWIMDNQFQMLVNGGALNGKSILPANTVSLITSNQIDDRLMWGDTTHNRYFGLGFGIYSDYAEKI